MPVAATAALYPGCPTSPTASSAGCPIAAYKADTSLAKSPDAVV